MSRDWSNPIIWCANTAKMPKPAC